MSVNCSNLTSSSREHQLHFSGRSVFGLKYRIPQEQPHHYIIFEGTRMHSHKACSLQPRHTSPLPAMSDSSLDSLEQGDQLLSETEHALVRGLIASKALAQLINQLLMHRFLPNLQQLKKSPFCGIQPDTSIHGYLKRQNFR